MAVKQTDPVWLGRRIRDLRLKLGLSKEDLAASTYTGAYISHLEKGRRRASQDTLEHIAARLGITFEQLVSGRDPHEDLRLEIATQQAVGKIHNGEVQDALEMLDDVRPRAADSGHRRALESAEIATASALYKLGRLDEAAAAFERALELTADGPPERSTSAVVGKARCLLDGDDDPRSAIHLLEAHLLELQRGREPDPGCEVEVYAALIPCYFETGMLEAAKAAASKGWERAPLISDIERRGCLYVNRAQLLLTQGEPREALASLSLAEDVYRQLGWRSEGVKVALARSFVLTDQGDLEAAEEVIRAAMETEGAVVSVADRIRALTRLAHIRRRRGNADEARNLARHAVGLAQDGFGSSRAEAEREFGLCLSELGDADGALTSWRTALEGFIAADDHEEAAKTARLIGDHLLAAGDVEGAAAAYRRGLGAVAELH